MAFEPLLNAQNLITPIATSFSKTLTLCKISKSS